MDRSSLRQAPGGIDGQNYDFVDLDGEGIAGILTAAASPAPGLYYKRNLGGGTFEAAERLPAQPSLPAMAADARLVSLNADGRLDVARFSGPSPAYYERTRGFSWAPFTPFQSLPRIDFAARGVHFLDVDGDGLTDILAATDDAFVWYSSLSRAGYGPPNRVTQAHDEDRGAVVLTTDDNETIFLADMSGDGLSDLVRIRNASVCYWPNLGYGRFGARITMHSPPVFDTPDSFDPRRVRLGDIDGTGPTNIVYLSRRGAVVCFNRAGNGWAEGIPISLPLAEALNSVRIADLLGTGTSCLVWSSTDPADAEPRCATSTSCTAPSRTCSARSATASARRPRSPTRRRRSSTWRTGWPADPGRHGCPSSSRRWRRSNSPTRSRSPPARSATATPTATTTASNASSAASPASIRGTPSRCRPITAPTRRPARSTRRPASTGFRRSAPPRGFTPGPGTANVTTCAPR